jgi:hypothetical protein
LVKEISAASNIKDRSNRQNVQRLLTILNKRLTGINLNTLYNLGVFCFVGINEYGEEIIEFIEPEIKLDLFYYSCSNKFETLITSKYIGIKISGTIVFANGDECLGYQFKQGQFIKIFGLNGNLVKRHNKGGYSANRFARIAEESRHIYVVRICDRLRELNLNGDEKIWIYGSDEIIEMILKTCTIKLFSGGFLNFNSNTIKNTKHWLEVLTKSQEKNYDSIYKEILEYLELNTDMLDFNPVNKNKMKYFIDVKHNDNNKLESNQIPIILNSKYYSKLVIFEYIGVKFYNTQSFENEIYEE